MVEVPAPAVSPGYALIRSAYSLISSGTELATIDHQAASPLKRALARPETIRSLAKEALRDGLNATRERVADRLSSWIPVGYSVAGTVLEVGPGVEGLLPGDRVAASGAEHAHHAELVAVPARLVVSVPAEVDLPSAAFAPVGAIALQAVRRSGATLGEMVVVIGLGLVGLLVCQLLRASGCRVLGLDPNINRCKLAEQVGCTATASSESLLREINSRLSGGLGADAVIVSATTPSDTPVNDAFELAREKGRVVVVGDVGMGLDRRQFYRKELDLLMSRSMGPGRYDPQYEVGGVDYPPAYVRWTEARNIEACLALMAEGQLVPGHLVSGQFALEEAASAYSHLSEGGEGVASLLRYRETDDGEHPPGAPVTRRVAVGPDTPLSGRIGVGLIGAGNFARHVHLPLLKRSRQFALRGVAGRRGPSVHHAAQQFGAAYASTDVRDILSDPEVAVVWITTPHDSHASLAAGALEAGKHVFVEKPVALTMDDCMSVRQAVRRSGRLLTVGFNRRFAPASSLVREHFSSARGPKNILYRVRAGHVPDGNWLNDTDVGGGRLLGECVHFFDWMAWLLGEEPQQVQAVRTQDEDDSVTAVVRFSGSSVGTLIYTGSGASSMPKERIEVLGGDLTAIVDDFQAVELRSGSGRRRRKSAKGKGYVEQMHAFVRALQGDKPLAVSVEDGIRATACALAAEAALREDKPQRVSVAEPCAESQA